MRRSRLCAQLLAVVLASSAAAPAWGTIDHRRYRSVDCNVTWTVPGDWVLSEQASFPGVLVVATRRGSDARMTLAAERTGSLDLEPYARLGQESLRKAGYLVSPVRDNPGGAQVFRASTPDRSRQVWQAYVAHEGVTFIVTLAAPAARASSVSLAFNESLRTLEFPLPAPASARCPIPALPTQAAPKPAQAARAEK